MPSTASRSAGSLLATARAAELPERVRAPASLNYRHSDVRPARRERLACRAVVGRLARMTACRSRLGARHRQRISGKLLRLLWKHRSRDGVLDLFAILTTVTLQFAKSKSQLLIFSNSLRYQEILPPVRAFIETVFLMD